MVQRRYEVEVFGGRQTVVERSSFRNMSNPFLGLERLLDDIEAGNGGAAARRADHPGENLDGGGLPGAVRSQESENLAGIHTQVQIAESDLRTVLARQMLGANHWSDATGSVAGAGARTSSARN